MYVCMYTCVCVCGLNTCFTQTKKKKLRISAIHTKSHAHARYVNEHTCKSARTHNDQHLRADKPSICLPVDATACHCFV